MKKLKNAASVLAQMLPHYPPLQNRLFASDFVKLLPKKHQDIITRAYTKGAKLYLLVKHPAHRLELKHDDTKISLKLLIKTYAKAKPLSKFDELSDIEVLVDRHFKPPVKAKEKKSNFLELSLGKFKNNAKNAEIFEAFERVRAAILRGLDEKKVDGE